MTVYEVTRDRDAPDSSEAKTRTGRMSGICADILRKKGYTVEHSETSTTFITDRPVSALHRKVLDALITFPYKVTDAPQ